MRDANVVEKRKDLCKNFLHDVIDQNIRVTSSSWERNDRIRRRAVTKENIKTNCDILYEIYLLFLPSVTFTKRFFDGKEKEEWNTCTAKECKFKPNIFYFNMFSIFFFNFTSRIMFLYYLFKVHLRFGTWKNLACIWW